MFYGSYNGRLYFELHDEEPIIIQPPIIIEDPIDDNGSTGGPDIHPPYEEWPWDFWVNRSPDGISFNWENPWGQNYNLILYSGDTNIYYGGHPAGYAEVNFADWGLTGTEPLHGEFWLYDDYTHEFISETSKFIIFPDFDGEPFRVMIDQHWVETENGRELEGFSLLWDEDRELSNTVIKMDLFQPNPDPADDRIFSKPGESTENAFNYLERKIDVSLGDYNFTGNELLEITFWKFNATNGAEIANSGYAFLNLSDWTGIPSSAFVPETLEGLKLRITERTEHADGVMQTYYTYTDRSVTLGKDGTAVVDGVPTEYEYSKSDNIGRLQLDLGYEQTPPFEVDDTIVYEMYFDSEDFGHGTLSAAINDGSEFEFEVIQRGWDVHYFSDENITELTGLEDAQAGYYFLGPDGWAEGYLEPVVEIAPSIFSFSYEDQLLIDWAKYPGPSSSDFVEKLPKEGFLFYEDEFGLPRKAKEYLEQNYRWDDGLPIGYWEEERPTPDGFDTELVAHLDNGIQVIFYLDGTFNREYDPYEPPPVIDIDPQLSFNNRASNWGTDKEKFREGVSDGDKPVYVDIRRFYPEDADYGSILYKISLLNRLLEDGEEPVEEDFDLSNTDLPAGTPLTITINYESESPRYSIVSGAEVSAYQNRYPDWDRSGSFTIKAKTVEPATDTATIGSTFSITVQMGGERDYGGAIFETNAIGLDVGSAKFTGAWDSVFSFNLEIPPSESDADIFVRALLPKNHLNWHFGIYDEFEVKAALSDEENGVRFVEGSRFPEDEEGDENMVGSQFTRIRHKGKEPQYSDPFAYMPGMMPMEEVEYLAIDDVFGFDETVFDPNALVGIGEEYIDPAIGQEYNDPTLGYGDGYVDPTMAGAGTIPWR